MSNFYKGQTFYGVYKRRVIEYKFEWENEALALLYLRDVTTGRVYSVSKYYLGKSLFLNEDNAQVAAGLKREVRRKYKYTKTRKKYKREYPGRMYDRLYRDKENVDYEKPLVGRSNYDPAKSETKIVRKPSKGRLEEYLSQAPTQREDDWSKYDYKVKNK